VTADGGAGSIGNESAVTDRRYSVGLGKRPETGRIFGFFGVIFGLSWVVFGFSVAFFWVLVFQKPSKH
jgi:hypothetical protein